MSIHFSVYLIILVTSCCQYKHVVDATTHFEDYDHGYFRNSPCPNAADIQPCLCTYDEDVEAIDMGCYEIADEQELFHVFNSTMTIPNFRRLDLSTKQLSTLEDAIFGDVTFEEVWATCFYGSLTSVGHNTFIKSASTLKTLILYDNRLSDFPFETLSQYTRLEFLDLGSNPLTSFPIITSETLRYLYVYKAKYHSIPAAALDGLPNLELLDARQTHIDSMATGLFASLTQLKNIYMYKTRLTHLESQQFGVSSTVIELIDLHSNKIAIVDADAFIGVQSGTINLKDNMLTTLPEATWRPVIDAGVTLLLEGNDLTCGCDVAWLVLEPLYHSQVDDAFCQSGEKLVNLDPHIFDSC